MKKVCIFDLDGTIIDTLDSLTLSVNLTMKELGLSDITRSECRDFIGNGARVLIEKSILESRKVCEEDFLDRAIEVYKRVFAENCMYQVLPYAGINEMLDKLKAQGVRLAILSNKPHERTVEIVEHYYGEGYFDYIQGQCDSLPRKPDPESINYVINQLGVPKHQCIYIGDSEIDIITGRGADIDTIGVSWGFRDRIVLEEVDASVIVDHPRELMECISSMSEKEN